MILLDMTDKNESNELDRITREKMTKIQDDMNLVGLSLIIGVIIGLVLASFLHKYIVHPLGF